MTEKLKQQLTALAEQQKKGEITISEFKARKNKLIEEASVKNSKRAQRSSTSKQQISVTRTQLIPSGPFDEAKLISLGAPLLEGLSQKPTPAKPSNIPLQKGFPDWNKISPEKTIKYEFNPRNGKWVTSEIWSKMAPRPFAKGAMRVAFHMQYYELDKETSKFQLVSNYVAKMSLKYYEKTLHLNRSRSTCSFFSEDDDDYDIIDDRNDCFQDVQLQMFAKYWAKRFNECDPPKKVDFLPAFCITLVSRKGRPTCCVEPYIEGTYKKHNNNYGYVSEDSRNTPQAFSHFTYHTSCHTLLICDIQGVGDVYTDPLMHSTIDEDFGRGNLGQEGMDRFLSTHSCNAICEYLNLPSVNAKPSNMGTVPGIRRSAFPPKPERAPPERIPLELLSAPPAETLRPPSDDSCCIL